MVQISVDAENENEQTDLEQQQSVNDTSNSHLFTAVTNPENDDLLQWFDVTRSGNLDDMKELLLHGADVGWEDDQKRTALHICAGYGYYQVVSLLLDFGASVNAKDENSSTALHLATWHGKTDVVQLLLAYGANIEATDNNLDTALHMAVSRRFRKLVELLLNQGAPIDVKDIRLLTPFYIAASLGHKAIVAILLDYGANMKATIIYRQNATSLTAEKKADIGIQLPSTYDVTVKLSKCLGTAFHQAAANGHEQVVDLLANSGAAVNEKNEDRYTALHLASRYGQEKVVEVLLRHGASVDAKCRFSLTSLHMAVEAGNKKIIQMLLSYGADINAVDNALYTALHAAIDIEDSELSIFLINNHSRVDLKNGYRETAFHMAARKGMIEVVRVLLIYGVDPTIENCDSDTALHLAAENGHSEVLSEILSRCKCVNKKFKDERTLLANRSEVGDIQMVTLLLNHGADIEAVDISGQTPLLIAVKAAHMNIVSLLIDKGANVEQPDNDSLTALHWSAKEGHCTILNLLLQEKANIGARTKCGDTALHLAAESNHSNIIANLIENDADINVKNDHGNSPLQVAVMKGHFDIIYQLKKAGSSIENLDEHEQWLLYQAADVGQIELVKKALRTRSDAEDRASSMNTALCRAVEHGQLDVVSYLLDNGADIETCDIEGAPLLFLAGEHPETVSTLIHRGACVENLKVKNRNQSVLHHYASLNQIDALHILCTNGLNIHSTDDDGNTALHYAIENGHHGAATMLLEQGLDINHGNRSGKTALHIAVECEFLDLAKLLIDYGIDLEAKDLINTNTALHLATRKYPTLASLLIERNADVNATDAYGNTPLHFAANSDKETCILLIERGANINARQMTGYSPLHAAASTTDPDLVSLLLTHGASINSSSDFFGTPLELIINRSSVQREYHFERNFITVVKLLIDAGANTTGIRLHETVEEKFPQVRHILKVASNSSSRNGDNIIGRCPTVDQHLQEIGHSNVALNVIRDDYSEGYESKYWLRERKTGIGSRYLSHFMRIASKVSLSTERWLMYTRHKYGYGFPISKRLQLDDFLYDDRKGDGANFAELINFAPSLTLLDTMSIYDRFKSIIQALLDCFGAQLFMSDYYFMLELSGYVDTIPPDWASHFDKMKGIIREPGRLIVQIPQMKTSLSINAWHRSMHPYLRFIDAVYVCRRSCTRLGQEVFSNLLGGSEQKLAADLHALLIAGFSILSVASGKGLVEKLVMAILGVKLDPAIIPPPNDKAVDWKIRNRRHCPCNVKSFHRPLSPVAAAKAIGMDIWRNRDEQLVNRVWDLHQDKLGFNVDAREVIFVTHRWSKNEKEYQDVMKTHLWSGQRVSRISSKLRRIRNALLKHTNTRYAWIDTICIDKSNLSELDEAIRSMYKWYSSCAAVVLDSGTTLNTWCSRGWCLQEGAAAGVLCGISKEGSLVTIQQLAIEQHQDLCTLDLHLYYRPGNAAEILARMDTRETTRKEDMTYAMAGVFDIHLTLAYGEGIKSRKRLLHELAVQKGDLSFLSFKTIQKMDMNYLPLISQINYVIADCTKASTSITVSHFGMCFEVELVRETNAKKTLQMLKSWRLLSFAKGRCLGIEDLIAAMESWEHQGLPVELAIMHDIRSLILVQTYNAEWQASGWKPIRLCYRIQCCQIEEIEFKRLFGKTSTSKSERIWLGDRPDSVNISQFENEWAQRVERSAQYADK